MDHFFNTIISWLPFLIVLPFFIFLIKRVKVQMKQFSKSIENQQKAIAQQEELVKLTESLLKEQKRSNDLLLSLVEK